MRFSVIVPVYNTEKYLCECIDSVLAQTCPDWELILVDDGSTDSSGVLADRYAQQDQRIRVIHKKNNGPFIARCDGIKEAAGDYLLFLDSDDYWREDCLETVSAVIDEVKPDVVMFDKIRFWDGGNEISESNPKSEERRWLEKEHFYEVLISCSDYNAVWTKAWKRQLFDGDPTDITAFAGITWGEDKVHQLYPITRAESIYRIPERLYFYRYHAASIMRTLEISRVPMMLSGNMFRQVYAYMKRWNMDDELSREKIAVYYLRNFLFVYYRLRRSCKDREARRQFRRYPWESFLDSAAFRYRNSSLLSSKERLKLLIARYFRFL